MWLPGFSSVRCVPASSRTRHVLWLSSICTLISSQTPHGVCASVAGIWDCKDDTMRLQDCNMGWGRPFDRPLPSLAIQCGVKQGESVGGVLAGSRPAYMPVCLVIDTHEVGVCVRMVADPSVCPLSAANIRIMGRDGKLAQAGRLEVRTKTTQPWGLVSSWESQHAFPACYALQWLRVEVAHGHVASNLPACRCATAGPPLTLGRQRFSAGHWGCQSPAAQWADPTLALARGPW